MRRSTFVFFALSLFGCGSSTNVGTPTTTDAGGGKADTNVVTPKDSGSTTPDTGSEPEDTATTPDTTTSPDTFVATDTGSATDSTVVTDTATTIDTATTTDTFVADTKKPPVDTGGVPIDDTTGLACTKDDDCDKTGDGITLCSNGVFTAGTLNPSPICIGIDCFAGDGTAIYACDGDKGVCLPTSATSAVCMGFCEFDGTSGAAPTGCTGKNVCNAYGWGRTGGSDAGLDAGGKLTGVGYCFGGCKSDADCTGGDKCQVEDALCVKTLITYTKKPGDACTSADAASPAKCNCLYASGKGYCANACRFGETTCGTGFSCDPSLPLKDKDGTLFTAVPKGIAGYCLKNCTADADCTALGGYCEEMAGMKGQKTCQVGTRP